MKLTKRYNITKMGFFLKKSQKIQIIRYDFFKSIVENEIMLREN